MTITVGFDDVDVDNSHHYVRLSMYEGFKWTNFDAYNPPNNPHKMSNKGEGYYNGVVSGAQEAFSLRNVEAHIAVADGRFDLKSGYLTAAYDDMLQVTAIGYKNGEEVYHETYAIIKSAPTLIEFKFAGIDEVSFSSSTGNQIVFDDLVFGHIKTAGQSPSLAKAFSPVEIHSVDDAVVVHAHGDLLQPGMHPLA